MLGSITPLGERARNSTWGVTTAAYALGSTAAGAVLGGLLGAAGDWLLVVGPAGAAAPILLLACLIAVGVAVDLRAGGSRVPSIRRQVNEEWLHRYRGWVYGLGFGFQLGLGIATIVTTAATYLTFGAALLSGSWATGAIVGGAFGLLRALPVLAAAPIRRPDQLFRLDDRLRRWDRPSRQLAIGLEVGLLIAAVTIAMT